MPQLFLINSGVWEQKSDIEIVQEQMVDPVEVKVEPKEDSEESFLFPDRKYICKHYTVFFLTPKYDYIILLN